MSSCHGAKEELSNETFYKGADLSYVNEMIDCEGIYHANGQTVNPYQVFADSGANLIRFRLWHNPDWTNGYSNYKDVERGIKEVKKRGVAVLLDFHYSDTWADPHGQLIPKAWKGLATNVLGDSLYQYTFSTLKHLYDKQLLPEMVQIGNETNNEILIDRPFEEGDTINWKRNLFLLNKGISAVEDFNKQYASHVETTIHIAQPENALSWFADASQHGGLKEFDWIGLSYYPKWSVYSMDSLSYAIDSLHNTYQKHVMVVETSYPYTLEEADSANNVLGQDALISGYPASPEGQLQYMTDLVKQVKQGGGEGVIYWEPAWISTDCKTLWGKGSHWDNATFFDAAHDNEALPAFHFFQLKTDEL